jgi:hypothetical protein
VLPWVELLVGMCLIVRRLTGGAALLAVGLGITFVVAQASALARGLTIDCGCFGAAVEPIGPATIARAAGVLMAAVATLALVARTARQNQPPPATAVADGGGVV